MRPPRIALGLLAALVLSLLAAPTARAQDARELFLRGQAAYDTGEYQTAIDLWQRAYELDPRPLLQFNIAQALERLGQLQAAIAAYEIFIRDSAATEPRQAPARARVAALQRRLEATGIRVTGAPEGAAILVDGQDAGRLPRPDPIRVSPGPHRIVIRADGYEDFESQVAVSAGQALELPVRMVPHTGEAEPEVDLGLDAEPTAGGGGPQPIGIVLTVLGGTVLVAGAITGILAITNANSSVDGDDGNADSARTFAILTDILLPVGGVTAGIGIILMLTLRKQADPAATAVVPLLGPGTAGVGLQGRF